MNLFQAQLPKFKSDVILNANKDAQTEIDQIILLEPIREPILYYLKIIVILLVKLLYK